MAPRQAASSDAREGRRTASATNNLDRLSQRFAEFHRRHPRRTRIPSDLRRATLAALEQGVSRTDVRRACGVSYKQLQQWQSGRAKIVEHAEPTEPGSRVFSVVGDGPTLGADPADSEQDQLELRLAGWSISVRRVDR